MIPSKMKQPSLLVTSSEETTSSGSPKLKFWMLAKSENSKNCKKDRTDMLEEPDDSLPYINSVNFEQRTYKINSNKEFY